MCIQLWESNDLVREVAFGVTLRHKLLERGHHYFFNGLGLNSSMQFTASPKVSQSRRVDFA